MLYIYGDDGAKKLIVGPTVYKQSNTIIRYILFDSENKSFKKIFPVMPFILSKFTLY